MNRYIYIFTDCNRTCLHVELSNELKTINNCKGLSVFLGDVYSKVSRLVYQELLPSEEMALTRFQELSKYTRMQKERLIRKYNPNWVDLSNRTSGAPHLLPIHPHTTSSYTAIRS